MLAVYGNTAQLGIHGQWGICNIGVPPYRPISYVCMLTVHLRKHRRVVMKTRRPIRDRRHNPKFVANKNEIKLFLSESHSLPVTNWTLLLISRNRLRLTCTRESNIYEERFSEYLFSVYVLVRYWHPLNWHKMGHCCYKLERSKFNQRQNIYITF
jgi:hypothetical protein